MTSVIFGEYDMLGLQQHEELLAQNTVVVDTIGCFVTHAQVSRHGSEMLRLPLEEYINTIELVIHSDARPWWSLQARLRSMAVDMDTIAWSNYVYLSMSKHLRPYYHKSIHVEPAQ